MSKHNTLRSLAKLSEPSSTQRNDVLLGRYASKVKSCLTSEDTSYNFKETFKSALLEPDVKLSRDYELAQRRVTGSMLTELGAQQLGYEASSMM